MIDLAYQTPPAVFSERLRRSPDGTSTHRPSFGRVLVDEGHLSAARWPVTRSRLLIGCREQPTERRFDSSAVDDAQFRAA